MLASAGVIGAPMLAERANLGSIGSPRMLEMLVVVGARMSIAAVTVHGDRGSAIA